MLPSSVLEVRYYLSEDGRSPFEEWFSLVESVARAKLAIAIARLEHGNTSNVKSVGEGVHEYRLNFGPGYRVYFATRGKTLIVLLCGGDKSTQAQDIKIARILAADLGD